MHPWYAVKVRTRSEAQVQSLLEHKSFETFLPTYKESRQYSDRIKIIDSPLFSGYLFCRLDVNRRLPILQTYGVDYILTDPVPEPEIAAIDKLLKSGAVAGPWPFLRTGDRVRVERGSFIGVEGLLISERGTDRLVISVNMLQRSVAFEIDRAWVAPVR